MDLPTASQLAVAAALGGVGVAMWTLRSTERQAEANRQHDRQTRSRERRATAYVELLTALRRLQMRIDRTKPLLDYGEVPPEPLSDEESWRINALTDAYATEEARALIRA